MNPQGAITQETIQRSLVNRKRRAAGMRGCGMVLHSRLSKKGYGRNSRLPTCERHQLIQRQPPKEARKFPQQWLRCLALIQADLVTECF